MLRRETQMVGVFTTVCVFNLHYAFFCAMLWLTFTLHYIRRKHMFGGLLTKAAFLHLVCQKSRQGGGIDARWTATLFSIAKKTALEHLQQLVDDGDIVRDEIPWRTNAQKFFYRPSPRTELNYQNHVYMPDYKIWMNAMMEA